MKRAATRIARCLRCGQSCKVSADNPSRPFCSERCKLIDLGTWLNEGYRVPGTEAVVPDAPGAEPMLKE